MKQIIFALSVVTLVGCATTANYERILDSWVGNDEVQLVRQWGPPQQVYESGSRKFLTYSSSRNVYLPGTAPSYTSTVIGNTVYTNPVGRTPGQNIGLTCITTFELENNKVVSWQ